MHFFTRSRIIFVVLSAFFLFAFFGFTLWVRTDALRHFDFDTTVRLQANTSLRFDSIFSFLSVVGRFEFTISALVIILFVWTRFKVSKLLRIGAIIGIFGIAHVAELVGKTILEQPGPPRMFLRSEFSDFPGLHIFTDASYPSGHSLRIVFLGIIIGYLIWKTKLSPTIKQFINLAIVFLVLLMLYSRITLGEHWATDVIGGSFLGASAGFLALLFL